MLQSRADEVFAREKDAPCRVCKVDMQQFNIDIDDLQFLKTPKIG